MQRRRWGSGGGCFARRRRSYRVTLLLVRNAPYFPPVVVPAKRGTSSADQAHRPPPSADLYRSRMARHSAVLHPFHRPTARRAKPQCRSGYGFHRRPAGCCGEGRGAGKARSEVGPRRGAPRASRPNPGMRLASRAGPRLGRSLASPATVGRRDAPADVRVRRHAHAGTDTI
jgi:hypothetical protein